MPKHALLIITLELLENLANADSFIYVTQISVSFEQIHEFSLPSSFKKMSGPNASLSYTAVAMCNA